MKENTNELHAAYSEKKFEFTEIRKGYINTR